MIMDDMGAGVWYHDRWVWNSLMALERAACRQTLGHSSMCRTFFEVATCEASSINLVADLASVMHGWGPFMGIL
jgi:hypothetical protein